jgi:hypothetical protein
MWLLASLLCLTRRVSMDTAKQSRCLGSIRWIFRLLNYFHSLVAPRLFEGMPKSFFDAYHQYVPKSEPVGQYELRRDLYELFHYLNHTVLFGVRELLIDSNRCSHTTQERYASRAQRKMERLLIALA